MDIHRQTDGHGDSMTESARWGRLSENSMISLEDKVLYSDGLQKGKFCPVVDLALPMI